MCTWRTYKKVKLCTPKAYSGRKEVYVNSCIAEEISYLLNDEGKTIERLN